jgi:hypothetical protein
MSQDLPEMVSVKRGSFCTGVGADLLLFVERELFFEFTCRAECMEGLAVHVAGVAGNCGMWSGAYLDRRFNVDFVGMKGRPQRRIKVEHFGTRAVASVPIQRGISLSRDWRLLHPKMGIEDLAMKVAGSPKFSVDSVAMEGLLHARIGIEASRANGRLVW